MNFNLTPLTPTAFPPQLMVAFGRQQNVDIRELRFLFEVRILRGDETPNSLGAEDGDEIDVMLSQIGGNCLRK